MPGGAIEKAVPHGRTIKGRDKGSWENTPNNVDAAWAELLPKFENLIAKHPRLKITNNHKHLGTLGNCHHNYVTRENYFGQNVLVTRKGAVAA